MLLKIIRARVKGGGLDSLLFEWQARVPVRKVSHFLIYYFLKKGSSRVFQTE